MYLVESEGGAIACMLVALVLLGTWPAILALLEPRGRRPQHTCLDYPFTNFLTAVIKASTLGQIGAAKPHLHNFLSQLCQGENTLKEVGYASLPIHRTYKQTARIKCILYKLLY